MIKLKYSNLTDEQKEIICNGCGGKSGWLNPPVYPAAHYVFRRK